MDNYCYFKSTGRYGAIAIVNGLYDDLAKNIPVKVNKTAYTSRWSTQKKKVDEFNSLYEEVSTGDLYVNRFHNQLVTYTPYTYLNTRKTASASIPLLYNSCDSLLLTYGKLSSGIIHELSDRIDLYLNNFRTDTTTMQTDVISVKGASTQPTYSLKKRAAATAGATESWDVETGLYTLNVRHNGPVDVSIHCAGSATDLRTDTVSTTALELPQQPAEYHGPIIVEAEDMDYKSIKSCVVDPYNAYPSVRGHAGNGFMDMGTSTSAALRHVLTLAHAGTYKLLVRYTAPTRAGRISVSVNGTRSTLTLEKTATNEWRKTVVDAELKEGDNNLILTNTGGAPIYIDQVIYQPADTEEERFRVTLREAEHGKVLSTVDEAAEGETVTLTVLPEEGYALTAWNVIHGGITVTDDGTFVMPDDNVTLQPVFSDTTVVYALDFTDVLSGTIPAGWRCVQESNTVHEYPNSFSQGARTFVGLNGYQGKALYWREVSCEYGRQASYPLHLSAGKYRLTFAMAAWKQAPRYSVKILDGKGKAIAQVRTASAVPNVNGNNAGTVTSAKEQTLEFDVTEAANYVISFQNLDAVSGYDEFLLLKCQLNSVPDLTGIMATRYDANVRPAIFNLQGIEQPTLRRGVNIVRMVDGSTRKVLVR